MKSKNTEQTQRILLLLKIDANNLFKRIEDRKSEYLEIFSLRRIRSHFPLIFKNRYELTSVEDLSHCSTELITSLDQFYTNVEEMNWYLFSTQDMPATVEGFVDRKIRRLRSLLQTLNLYIDAELGIDAREVSASAGDFLAEEVTEDFSDAFGDGTSQES